MLETALPELEDPVGTHIALFDLYTDIEEMDRAGEHLVEAARRVSLGERPELGYFLYNHLELFAQLNPGAGKVFERLSVVISEDDSGVGANTLHLDQRKIYQHDLIPELLLTRHLHRARQISDPEYLVVLHDLCEYSVQAPLSPKSVLYILHDRALPHHEKAIEFLAHDSGVPFVDLNHLTPAPEALELLPRDFVRVRAACTFGMVAGEPLVAVLNPFNLQLREDVGRQIDQETHYYLTSAAGYQNVLDLLDG